MQINTSRAASGWLLGLWLAAAATSIWAQPYPSKSIEIIVPYAPGGTTDFVTRVIGQRLSEAWAQPVVVINRPGASGAIGADLAAQAAADGHTLCITGYTNRNLLFESPPPAPNPARDLLPVAIVAQAPLLLLANPAFAARDLAELLAQAKARPGQLNYASIGSGSPSHLAMEMLKRQAGIELSHVPYKGNGPAMIDLLADRVQLLFTSTGPVEAHLKSGKLKAIAVTGLKRLASLPDVPTISESGIPGYQFTLWYGIVAPTGTPKPAIDRLNAELRKTMASSEVKDKLAIIGGNLNVGSPEEMQKLLKDELMRWQKLAKDTGIQFE